MEQNWADISTCLDWVDGRGCCSGGGRCPVLSRRGRGGLVLPDGLKLGQPQRQALPRRLLCLLFRQWNIIMWLPCESPDSTRQRLKKYKAYWPLHCVIVNSISTWTMVKKFTFICTIHYYIRTSFSGINKELRSPGGQYLVGMYGLINPHRNRLLGHFA